MCQLNGSSTDVTLRAIYSRTYVPSSVGKFKNANLPWSLSIDSERIWDDLLRIFTEVMLETACLRALGTILVIKSASGKPIRIFLLL